MSGRENEPLDELVATLLEHERERPGPSADVMAALWSAIDAAPKPTAEPAPTDDGHNASGDGDPARPAPPLPRSTGALAAAGSRAATAVIASVSLVVGGLGGAWIHARIATPAPAEPRTVYVERPVPMSVLGASTTSSGSPSAVAPSLSSPPPAASSHGRELGRDHGRAASASAPGSSGSVARPERRAEDTVLARERSLLDMGRMALARGDTAGALSAVASLEAEAPNGQLVEEREVLAVQTLVTANRTADARRRAALFKMTYPTSPLVGIVEDAVTPR